ncbi:MAG TPA: RIP metalloprotease RseP [Candidatus Binatia bacterium]|nr:RIP metalloprotease RseP [Candidatus Binatia bacterium]
MITFLWSIMAFAVAIGVLISFHEYGHFWTARRLGVKVLRYAIGFGRPLLRRRGRDGTEYVLGVLPLGGYVKMLDEREGEVPAADLHRAFNRQPVWKRIAIVASGPAFNLLLAVVAYWIVYVAGVDGLRPVLAEPPANSSAARLGMHQGEEIVQLGGRPVPTWEVLRTELIDRALDREAVEIAVRDKTGAVRPEVLELSSVRVDPEYLFEDLGLAPYQPPLPPVLAEVMEGGPAAAAGFRGGDRLLSHDGEAIHSWQEWATWLRAHPGTAAQVIVQRNGEPVRLTVIVGRETRGGQDIGHFGARVDVPEGLWDNLVTEQRLGVLPALPAAVKQTAHMCGLTLKLLYRMVLGDVSVRHVSGPIQIAQIAGYSARIGLVSFLGFIAIVSISLGVLNLLPVPVLDGGHLLYYVVELVKGSPLSERAQQLGQQIGLTLLVALMGLAFYNDILRLIG